jgi:hypothetical protein
MVLPECAETKITERPALGKEALLSLTALLSTPHGPKDHGRDNLLQTAVDGCEGGHRGATNTSGPDDPKGRRSRAHPAQEFEGPYVRRDPVGQALRRGRGHLSEMDTPMMDFSVLWPMRTIRHVF